MNSTFLYFDLLRSSGYHWTKKEYDAQKTKWPAKTVWRTKNNMAGKKTIKRTKNKMANEKQYGRQKEVWPTKNNKADKKQDGEQSYID